MSEKHPVMISIAHNPDMGAWDLQILAGNFKTKEGAEDYAERVKEFLEEEADGEFETAQ